MKRRGWSIGLVAAGVVVLGLVVSSVLQDRQAKRERAEAVREQREALKALEVEARRRAERETAPGAPRTHCFGDGGEPAEWRCR
jgi:hypothetical protein